jgi:predicted secreted protein
MLNAILIGTVGGLSLSAAGAEKDEPAFVLNDQASGILKVSPGKSFFIKLPAQLGTGTVWSVPNLPKGIRQVGDSKVESGNGDIPGGVQLQVFHFVVSSAGKVSLTLIYSQPFEAGAKPVKTIRLAIEAR